MLHENIVVGDVHYIQNWSVADNTARDALSVAATDVGKVAQVTGTQKFFVLVDDSPMTWTELGGSGGAGDVVGPASATDNAIVRFDSTTGKLIQNSGITIADGASGTLSNTNSGDVTLNASVADIFGLSTQELTADDPGADRIVFWDDSAGKLTHLTAGTGLTITGTTIDASGGGGGITLGTPVTLTTQTSVDFTGIPAGTKAIYINLSGISTNSTPAYYLQIGDAGGIETSGYSHAVLGIQDGTSSFGSNFTDAFAFIDASGAAYVVEGILELRLLDSSTFTWSCVTSVGYPAGATNSAVWWGRGSKSLSAELTQLRITTSTGTAQFDAGKINIQYQS
jgi:hypothetical protein